MLVIDAINPTLRAYICRLDGSNASTPIVAAFERLAPLAKTAGGVQHYLPL
jgi:hypothetical protein